MAIGITMGDPGGIGPEVIVRALAQAEFHAEGTPLWWLFGDRKLLQQTAEHLQLPGPDAWKRVRMLSHPRWEGKDFPAGRLSEDGAQAQVAYIQEALHAIQQQQLTGLVTGPIHKQALELCGLPFCGHTEWLESFAQTRAVMMLAGPRLRVVPATVHIPLREVPKRLNPTMLVETFRITRDALIRWFGVAEPRIAVCGLNPHAGDGGMMGDEEQTILAPALEKARSMGVRVDGPYPGDTVFYFAAQGQFDAVVAMYHDQALAPLKLLHFDDAINVSLGLPFLRSSVDHGTAYDIAGKGIAKGESMCEALRFAVRGWKNRLHS